MDSPNNLASARKFQNALIHQTVHSSGAMLVAKQLNQSNASIFLTYTPLFNHYHALKVFPHKNGKSSSTFLNEIRFAGLNHKNVISIVHYEENKEFSIQAKAEASSYIVMEFAPYGDFFQLLDTNQISFDDDKLVRTYFHQLIEGLEYLHSKGVAHLDIKPENLLMGRDFQLKIADFDHSSLNGEILAASAGTLYYRPPELADGNCEDLEAADIYSAAITLFLFKTNGILPHREHQRVNGIDLQHLLHRNNEAFWETHCELQRKPESFFSEEFKDLFNEMTHVRPRERATIETVKDSEWYNGPVYSDQELLSLMKKTFESS